MILLDTCALLWLAADQEKLSTKAKNAIRQNIGQLFVSSISAFEIAIKARRGKLDLPMPAGEWFAKALEFHGIHEVAIDGALAVRAVELPPLHNDPCDRFIIATAVRYSMSIVTSDPLIAQYRDVRTVW